MSDNVKISVIVPCYNAEKFLHKCLNSLINQTFKDIEIICVNDCAKDSTAEILAEYEKLDSRISIVNHEQNKGLSAARNSGIAVAKGDYISFIDSDDFVELTMMEKLYNKAIATGAELVIGNLYLYFEDTGKTQIFRDERYFTYLQGRVFKLVDEAPLVSCIAAWDRLYKKELITENNLQFPVGLVYEDQPFSIQAMQLAKGITVVNEPLYYYRKNAGGSITDNEKKNDRYKFNFLEITRLSKTFMKEQGVYDVLRKEYMPYHFFNAAVHQHYITDKKKFKEFFDKMRELTSTEDFEVLKQTKQEYLADKYLEALESNNYKKFYRFSNKVSLAKKILRPERKNKRK